MRITDSEIREFLTNAWCHTLRVPNIRDNTMNDIIDFNQMASFLNNASLPWYN